MPSNIATFSPSKRNSNSFATWLPGPLSGRDCSDSQLPVCRLPEIRFVWVVEIGPEITEHWRHRIEAVVGDRHRLRVAQLGKRLHIEAIIALLVVGLRCCEVGLVGLGFAGQDTDVGIVATLGQVVANLELVFPKITSATLRIRTLTTFSRRTS